MVKVLIFGTFDRLHPGHRSFIRQAKRHGTHLTVVVGRDKTVRRLKKFWPKQTLAERMAALRLVPEVDRVVAGVPKNHLIHLTRHRPDIICLGYDQTSFTTQLQDMLRRRAGNKIRLVRLRPFRPHRYKSSIIKKRGLSKQAVSDKLGRN